ncbi:MAG: hypothetical protein O7F69_04635, partial [Alphaproteobacteria bacterium]|nr:hypothetical protein [Alphaproteobacteria bacterium]
IYHPRDRGILDRLKDTTNQPLRPPESYQNLTKLPSSQISLITPASPDVGGTAYVGEWSELLIGMRRELHFVVATVASDASDDAFPQYQIWVAAWLRADIQLGRPAAFVTIEELLAS